MSSTSSTEYIERYSRQLLLKDWSFATQHKVRTSKVLIDIPSEMLFWYAAAIGFEILHYTVNASVHSSLNSNLVKFNQNIKISRFKEENMYDFYITSEDSILRKDIQSTHRITIQHKNNDHLKLLMESNEVSTVKSIRTPRFISLDDLLGPFIIIFISEFV